MPIRFRCPGCEALLSIARRKSGTEIACPKCREALIVPPPVTPTLEPEPMRKRRTRLNDEAERTELDLTPPAFGKSDPFGGGPAQATLEPQATPVPRIREYSHGVEPPPRKPDPPKPKPAPPKIDEPPLFEQADFERLLDPVVKPVLPPTPPAKPEPPPGIAAVPSALAAEDGVYVSRAGAVMLGVAFVFLLGLSFAVGFWLAG